MKLILMVALTLSTLVPGNKGTKLPASLIGAWSVKQGNAHYTLVAQDGYFSFVHFDVAAKKFYRTYGGTVTESNGQLQATIEFDSMEKAAVGKQQQIAYKMSGNQLVLDLGIGTTQWTKLDDGNAPLAGNWRITGRMREGKIEPMPLRARKTVKLLSGTRFQWMAINTETGEFSGTGGGTYSFVNGKYTENIEFFSRDSSRVGASLSFEGTVKDRVWTHKGQSSKGDPIHEEWTRESK